jgi:putative membrane protein
MNRALAAANALLTTASLVCMVAGWRAIRRREVVRHRSFMLAAAAFSAAFVVVFVIRFVRFGFTRFEGEGVWRGVYYAIFFSHEPLAVINVPLVVVSLILGLRGMVAAHREVAKIALPVWAYVAVTGVAIFAMLYL